MKITYNFNDESVEIDVPEEWGELVVQFNRDEDSQDRNKRRHCYSLDTKVYEGKEYGALDSEIENFGEDEEPDEVELLYAGLDLLTEKQRDVLRMHFFEDMTFEEIGAVLGVSRVAAYQIKDRAVEQLKKYFFADPVNKRPVFVRKTKGAQNHPFRKEENG